ncbi:MAG: F-type H+-transporting ATPase subunit epsilon [Actinomycetota bacterium]|nr:F-type H+-transporting ATPase subunit epsilon [Actinomycetota bacterium]MDQ1500201.1 F-type H+-transporting ATPase subunit epsilon [Actinomycetota bacterium]
MEVKLVGPERIIYAGDASMVLARTLDGEIGILPGHAPLLGVLVPGQLRIVKPDGSEHRATVRSGFVEVCDNRVVVLADPAPEETAPEEKAEEEKGPTS